MAFKTLLTHVAIDRGSAARLRMTANVANALAARVIGLGAQTPWPFDDSATGSARRGEDLIRSTRADIAGAEVMFRAACAQAGCAADWRSEVAFPVQAMIRHARVADMILAYRKVSDDEFAYVSPDDLLMEAGAPVLFMPAREVEFKTDTILFAWKNTRETRRALSLSLPLLQLAKRVLVAAVCRESDLDVTEQELGDVAQRLRDHGIDASTLAEVAAHGAAGRRLSSIARAEQSDLIVAGGFGQSRMREWILGGVTRELMADASRYVLLCH